MKLITCRLKKIYLNEYTKFTKESEVEWAPPFLLAKIYALKIGGGLAYPPPPFFFPKKEIINTNIKN